MCVCQQVILQEERERNNLQLATEVFHKGLLMEIEIQIGMDDHVLTLTNKIGHGGELILELHSKW